MLSLFWTGLMSFVFYATALKKIIKLADTIKDLSAPLPKHLESIDTMEPDDRPQTGGSTFDFLNG